jgi:hypothetical protein
MHQIGSIRGPLLVAKAPLDLIPNEIHHIKLQPRTYVGMSEKHKVNHEAMDLIDVTNLWIEHFPVDTMHDIIN